MAPVKFMCSAKKIWVVIYSSILPKELENHPKIYHSSTLGWWTSKVGVALTILGVKPKVGEIGVTLKVPLCTPLITIEEHDLAYCCFRTFSRVVSHKKREERMLSLLSMIIIIS